MKRVIRTGYYDKEGKFHIDRYELEYTHINWTDIENYQDDGAMTPHKYRSSPTTIKCPLWNEKGWPRCLHLDNKIGVCHNPEGICEPASRKLELEKANE